MTSPPPLTIGAWLRHDFILEQVAAARPRSIVEFGPGLGAMGARLARVAEYEAVEIDRVSREQAKLILGDAVKGSIEELSRPTYDMVCAFEVLEHLEDDVGTLARWVDLLTPGGRVVVSVPAFAHQYGPHDERAGHRRRYDPEDMRRLLMSADLSPIDIRVVGFPIGHALQAGRNALARRVRPGSSNPDVRTGASGRLYQAHRYGRLSQGISWPFRKIQSHVRHRGTGLVAAAEKSVN